MQFARARPEALRGASAACPSDRKCHQNEKERIMNISDFRWIATGLSLPAKAIASGRRVIIAQTLCVYARHDNEPEAIALLRVLLTVDIRRSRR